ncbi:MAG: hypothetical protein AAFU85_16935 [Planctomycetota bacterium]
MMNRRTERCDGITLTVGLLVLLGVPHVAAQTLAAQTLTEQLRNDDPAKLVLQARETGQIVRGAILFHQGNIQCVKCHRATSEKDRIGPNLSELGADVTDASLVESILSPSKVIKKDYQTTKVLLRDGRVLTGIVSLQDDDALVLRDRKDVDRLITIRRDEIDEIATDPVSIMPDGLVNELKGRQQFLDLLRYVIDLKERGPDRSLNPSVASQQRELTSELIGRVLLRKHNCGACHEPKESDVEWLRPAAPDLRWSASHLSADFLATFIADPHSIKPGSEMPQMMPDLDKAERVAAASAITRYLRSLQSNAGQADPIDTSPASVVRGEELFHSVGCVACHAPRDSKALEQPITDSIPLGELRRKYTTSSLVSFLENPHLSRPNGRMPNLRLTHREAIDVSNYLLQPAVGLSAADAFLEGPDGSSAEEGKRLFESLSCANCHVGAIESRPDQPSLPTMDDLNPQRGCLSGDVGEWPSFQLSDSDVRNIRIALNADASRLSTDQAIDVHLTYFNCTACHDRRDLGGVSPEQRVHFQTTNLNLGEQGRIPPTLTGVGAKLKPKWMRDVMVNGRAIRPYMKTRMPQYGEENIAHLMDLLQSADHLDKTEFAAFENQKEIRELGLKLAGNQGLNCVACHTYQYKISDTMPAVDLTEMAERLEKTWFCQYMLAPQSFSPNTVMPSFWHNGKSMRGDLPGRPEYQVEALWQYLLDGRQARAPRGVIREPLEIVVGNEARMLRRSYPGIGKRGIGVGYPGGVNLAFDAEQLRLASIWKGRFVDPSGVWYGQGHGRVRPIGKTIQLAPGPELDQLDQPWTVDEGRPPNHRFRGYVLDAERRPTFRYEFMNVSVEDYFSEATDAESDRTGLIRRIKVTPSKATEPLRLRLLAGDDATISDDGKRVTGQGLTIQIASDQSAILVDDKASKMAIIRLDFETNQAIELVLKYQWQ